MGREEAAGAHRRGPVSGHGLTLRQGLRFDWAAVQAGVTRHNSDFRLVCSLIGQRWLLSVRKLTGFHG